MAGVMSGIELGTPYLRDQNFIHYATSHPNPGMSEGNRVNMNSTNVLVLSVTWYFEK